MAVDACGRRNVQGCRYAMRTTRWEVDCTFEKPARVCGMLL